MLGRNASQQCRHPGVFAHRGGNVTLNLRVSVCKLCHQFWQVVACMATCAQEHGHYRDLGAGLRHKNLTRSWQIWLS